MRNETEFKAEVMARFDKKKKEIKKRRQTLAATLPALALVLIVSAVFLSQSFGIIPNAESFDGAADGIKETVDGNVGAALGENESAKLDNFNVTTDDADLSTNTAGHSAVKDESVDTSSLSRIYSDKKKIDGFKALLGVWEEIFSEEETKAHATGADITLITEEMTEKYILKNNGIYTADMQKYIPLDDKEYEEIRRYLIENPSDE